MSSNGIFKCLLYRFVLIALQPCSKPSACIAA